MTTTDEVVDNLEFNALPRLLKLKIWIQSPPNSELEFENALYFNTLTKKLSIFLQYFLAIVDLSLEMFNRHVLTFNSSILFKNLRKLVIECGSLIDEDNFLLSLTKLKFLTHLKLIQSDKRMQVSIISSIPNLNR